MKQDRTDIYNRAVDALEEDRTFRHQFLGVEPEMYIWRKRWLITGLPISEAEMRATLMFHEVHATLGGIHALLRQATEAVRAV